MKNPLPGQGVFLFGVRVGEGDDSVVIGAHGFRKAKTMLEAEYRDARSFIRIEKIVGFCTKRVLKLA
jgi:hypothetical protein